MDKIKGILTDCNDGKETIVDLEYEIEERDGRRLFQLLNGVTGYESFYIDQDNANLNRMKEKGWLACAGTKGRWHRLFIPAEEMMRVEF